MTGFFDEDRDAYGIDPAKAPEHVERNERLGGDIRSVGDQNRQEYGVRKNWRHPRRWSGAIHNWTPIGPVTLNRTQDVLPATRDRHRAARRQGALNTWQHLGQHHQGPVQGRGHLLTVSEEPRSPRTGHPVPGRYLRCPWQRDSSRAVSGIPGANQSRIIMCVDCFHITPPHAGTSGALAQILARLRIRVDADQNTESRWWNGKSKE